MKALNSSEVKAQVKTVIDDLENVLGELREVVTELRGIVDQIDTITARLDIDGEGDAQAQQTNPSSSAREPPNGRVTSPHHFELGQTEYGDRRGQTPGGTTHNQHLPNGDLTVQERQNIHISQASAIPNHSPNPVSTHALSQSTTMHQTQHGSLLRRHRVGEDHVISPSVVRALTLGRGIPNGHVNTYQRGFSVDQALSQRDGQIHASTLPRQNLGPGAAVSLNGDIGASPTRFGTFRDGYSTGSGQPQRKTKPAPPQRRSATLGDYADYMTLPARASGETSRQASKEAFRSAKSQNLGREFERRRERCDPVPGSALRTHSTSSAPSTKKEKRVEFRTDDVDGSGRAELTRQHSLKQRDYEAIQRERYAGRETNQAPVRRENPRTRWKTSPRPMSVPTSWVQDEEGSWHRIAQNSLASDYGSLESFRSGGNYSSMESFRSESPGVAMVMDTRRPGTAPGREAAPPGPGAGEGTLGGGGDPTATYATINRQARSQYSTVASPSKGQSRQGAKGKDILMTEL
ncbi:Hypp1305 [Branchiostoma lanceolatum]|uniref:Hypp1305 protein n=1 Tax=Branchiostoma lanceolatum TaxID=7740 RepID=A0A8J9ZJF1_BRALA|nr:Hypp1305 [Branchiostoma lanceolatum]